MSRFAAFAKVIGQEACAEISAAFGGRQLYVPGSPQHGSDLVRVLGMDAARALGKRFGGCFFHIPLAPGRALRIARLREEGHTVRSIADAVGCTERYVYRVLAREKEIQDPMEPESDE